MKQHLIDFYLDWTNNYLSTETMAEHYGLSIDHVRILIGLGRHIHKQIT